jgi:hypothetical protein
VLDCGAKRPGWVGPVPEDCLRSPAKPAKRARVRVRDEVATSSAPVERVTWQRLSEVDMRPIRFVSKPLLQADAFHAVVGRKGMGKGTLIAAIAAAVTRG